MSLTNNDILHSAVLIIDKNKGLFKSKTYTFSINGEKILKAKSSSSLNIFNGGSCRIYTTDIEVLSIDYCNNKNHNENKSKWRAIGNMISPGLLFDKSIVYDSKKEINTKIVYKNTSRSGDLMELKVFIPEIVSISNRKNLIKIISDITFLPIDCSNIIIDYCQLFWINNNSYITLENKLPKWNQNINAYTLEFGGRALIPSVHNFQLIKSMEKHKNNDNKNIILQLGKRTNNPSSFNIDYSFPLSPFQAFVICLSVLERAFVWD